MKTGSHIALFITSLLSLVFAVIGVVVGILMVCLFTYALANGVEITALHVDNETFLNIEFLSVHMGNFLICESIIALIVSIFGIHASHFSAKVGRFLIITWIGLALEIGAFANDLLKFPGANWSALLFMAFFVAMLIIGYRISCQEKEGASA